MGCFHEVPAFWKTALGGFEAVNGREAKYHHAEQLIPSPSREEKVDTVKLSSRW
jgi:hypothetical protein